MFVTTEVRLPARFADKSKNARESPWPNPAGSQDAEELPNVTEASQRIFSPRAAIRVRLAQRIESLLRFRNQMTSR
jgi:hypothetical protein